MSHLEKVRVKTQMRVKTEMRNWNFPRSHIQESANYKCKQVQVVSGPLNSFS